MPTTTRSTRRGRSSTRSRAATRPRPSAPRRRSASPTPRIPVDELFWGVRRVLDEPRRRRPAGRRVRGPALGRADDARPGRAPRRDAPAPILLLCTARDELLETATAGPRSPAAPPSSSTGSRPTRRAELAPASPGAPCRPATLRTIVETAGGNPLFLEQMLAMIQDAPRRRRRRPADDPRAPLGPARPARRRPARGRRHGIGRRARFPRGGCRRARARRAPARRSRGPGRPQAAPARPVARRGHDHRRGYTFQHILIRDAAYAGLLKRAPRGAARAVRGVGRRGERRPRAASTRRSSATTSSRRTATRRARAARRPRPRASAARASERLRSAGRRASPAATCRPPRTCSGARRRCFRRSTRTGSTCCSTSARR